MKKPLVFFIVLTIFFSAGTIVIAATTIPNEIKQPGTQPGEIGGLESPDRCDNCHAGYDQAVEPSFNWQGSMMANASRDPIFWATLAIAEQDFDGSGDLCIRCHSTSGYIAGNSTPTNGSGLADSDASGVDCDFCHKMTNTDQSEFSGVMNPPYIANDEDTPATGYYGTGMTALSNDTAKLGPYSDADARHQFAQSLFHRDVDYCGSCHDVSNPAVGDLAHNNGAQSTADPVVASGELGSPVDQKAAFNNFPYQYGIVERTYSEYKSGALSNTLVSNYSNLPADLQAGAIEAAFLSSGGDYTDGSPRYFSCQTCHMPAVTGYGANKNGLQLRTDLPLHDMTGGNYWVPDAIKYQDTANTLLFGGGLTDLQISAIDAGKLRAQQQLDMAASLSVSENILKITNLTGHKLISGYPEGRRMWVNIKWFDSEENLIREDGAYDTINVTINGTPTQVKSLLDLHDPNTKIYEVFPGMTQEWANQLIDLGYDPNLPLSFDRISGAVNFTLGDLAAQPAGTNHKTFHFVLNNTIVEDNRIPPFGFDYEEARKRNLLPVPADQYGGTPGGTYDYWDSITLNPPTGAEHASISLLYQPTSWEYVQFVYEANDGSNAFLAQEGQNLLDAWMNTGMAEPYLMASTTWEIDSEPPESFNKLFPTNGDSGISTSPTLAWETSEYATGYEYCLDIVENCETWEKTSETSVKIEGLSEGTTYYWHVRAINDEGTTYSNGSNEGYWSFTTLTSPTPPGPFNKTDPADGATYLATSPTLSWSTSEGATSYDYCFGIDQTCDNWTNTAGTSAQLNGLSEGTTYFWHVRANNDDGTTFSNDSESAYWSFTTLTSPPGDFTKTAPADSATGVSTSPTLSWSTSTEADSYDYCYDTSNNDECSDWTSSGASTSVVLNGLSENTTYYWQVRANNTGGITFADGNEISFWSFTTKTSPVLPEPFGKIEPADGEPDISTSPVLSWETSLGATSFEFCYDKTNDGLCSSWTPNGTETSKTLSGLDENSTYYWHVRARNDDGTTYSDGGENAIWSFTTLTSPPGEFNKIGPADLSVDVSADPTLIWETSSSAESYQYCMNTTASCELWISTGSLTSQTVYGLDKNTKYYWQIRALKSDLITYANGSETAFWEFTTTDTPINNQIYLPLVLK